MEFLDEYKRLDNLCKDMFNSDKGVTTYIEKLERVGKHKYKDEYSNLKKYRHIRNMLVHDNNVYEEDYCNSYDLNWIIDFRERIMYQNDPLSLERKLYKSKKRKSNNNSLSTESSTFIILVLVVILSIIIFFVMY